MRNILIRPIFFILIMILLLFSACSKASDQPMRRQATSADFTLEGLDGESIILSEILKTKIVVLDFWATWCPYCIKAIPQIEKFYAQNKDKVAVIGIDVRESKAKVEKFVKKMGITYPIALDYDGSVARLYNVRGIPTVVAVDKDGKIIYYGHSIEEMKTKIDFEDLSR